MLFKRPYPPVGERRFVRRFAFLPTRIDSSYIVWLGLYYEIQICLFGKWVTCHWADTGLPATETRKAIKPMVVRTTTLTEANARLAALREQDMAAIKAAEETAAASSAGK